jgi:hypothetical protein
MIAIGISYLSADFGHPLSSSSVVIFREIDSSNGDKGAVFVQPSNELSSELQRSTMVPISAMETTSLSGNGGPIMTVGESVGSNRLLRGRTHLTYCSSQIRLETFAIKGRFGGY